MVAPLEKVQFHSPSGTTAASRGGSTVERRRGGAGDLGAIEVNLRSVPHAIETVSREVAASRGFMLFTLNLDHLVKLRADAVFRQAYQRAEFVSADGWPIVWSLKGRRPDLERTTGADLAAPLCRRLAEISAPIYFVGPGVTVQAEAIARLCRDNPDLRVTGAEAPHVADPLDPILLDQMARRIRLSSARVCLVSLGAPKQELLADALHRRCPNVGFICTGAALDFIAGAVTRAPLWVQRFGMEWVWRAVGQPRRLGVRYLKCALAFLVLAAGRDSLITAALEI